MQVPPDFEVSPDKARKEILTELWVTYIDRETPPAVKVAALDKIAKIQSAYAPIKVEAAKPKFMSLADFYATAQTPSAPEEEAGTDV
jgi:hypothetical protein